MPELTLSMAQISIGKDMDANEKKTLSYCDAASESDLLFFPEIQYAPFFPQHTSYDASKYLLTLDSIRIARLCQKAKEHHYYLSPNLYISNNNGPFDTSLWITPKGTIEDTATMVHIFNAPDFNEANYYTPSKDGFKVFDTPFGKIGIVICFDRHFPESVRTCAALGADLVIIPTVNTKTEPLELFEQEIRVLSMQNRVFIAMCNRVGKDDHLEFAGQSLVTHPSGKTLFKADEKEQLITIQLNLQEAKEWQKKYPFLTLRRFEMYK